MHKLIESHFHGVRMTPLRMSLATDVIIEHARHAQAFSVEYLAVNNLVLGVKDKGFSDALQSFDLTLADGRAVFWLNKFGLKIADCGHVPARNHMLDLCSRASKERIKVGLYGSTPEVIAKLGAILPEKIENLDVAFAAPSVFRPLSEEETDAIVEQVIASGVRLLFVGLGCPRQEKFVADIKERVGIPCLCVGSAFEIHAGMRKNPPVWISKLGVEWVFRLLQNPRGLWRRYLTTNFQFLVLLVGGSRLVKIVQGRG